MTIYANQEAYEGTVTAETTITLARKSRAIEIINDSGIHDLTFKFNTSETAATLRPKEAVSMDFITNIIILDGTNTPYRIRVVG